jgi:hypothetical protein
MARSLQKKTCRERRRMAPPRSTTDQAHITRTATAASIAMTGPIARPRALARVAHPFAHRGPPWIMLHAVTYNTEAIKQSRFSNQRRDADRREIVVCIADEDGNQNL